MRSKSLPKAIIPTLQRGGIGVLPTDTLYGIVGSAYHPETVKRIYALRRRNPQKPMIVLIGKPSDAERFGVLLDADVKKFLKRVWPGPVSVILPQDPRRKELIKKFRYLHRGTKTLAFRLPAPRWLRALLKKTGPLVAPSANFEGLPPAKTMREAKKYFHARVDFYADAGRRDQKPSSLIAVKGRRISVLRP